MRATWPPMPGDTFYRVSNFNAERSFFVIISVEAPEPEFRKCRIIIYDPGKFGGHALRDMRYVPDDPLFDTAKFSSLRSGS